MGVADKNKNVIVIEEPLSDTQDSLQFHDVASDSSATAAGSSARVTTTLSQLTPSKPMTSSSAGNWLPQLDNYSKYFNVTTEEIQIRLRLTLLLKDTFLEELAGRLDFYGPIWAAFTLGLILFLVGTLSSGTSTDPMGAFTSSLIWIFFYVGPICGGAWAAWRWLGAEGVYFSELFCLLGYSLILFFPVTIVALLQIGLLTWISTGLVIMASAVFIYRNIHPILRTSSLGVERARLYSLVTVTAHSLFLLSLKIFFL